MTNGKIALVIIVALVILYIVYYVIKNKFVVVNFTDGQRIFCFSGGKCFDTLGRRVSAINTENIETVNVDGRNIIGVSNIPANYLHGIAFTEGNTGNFVLGDSNTGER